MTGIWLIYLDCPYCKGVFHTTSDQTQVICPDCNREFTVVKIEEDDCVFFWPEAIKN
jgi:uncharacterized protein YbaR (Trm112 family)